MPRNSNYTYNPKTGSWNKSATSNASSTKKNNNGSNLTNTSTNKNSSKGSVEKKNNDIEVNTLVASLKMICTDKTIRLKAGDTVNLKGFGKYLSGNYFVKDVTRTLSSSGYSQSATVIKTDFGKSLKMTAKGDKSEPTAKVQSTPTPQKSPQKTYTVKKGDCLWKIAKQYYGNGGEYGKIYDANTHQIVNPNLIYVGQKIVIP